MERQINSLGASLLRSFLVVNKEKIVANKEPKNQTATKLNKYLILNNVGQKNDVKCNLVLY